MCRTCWASDISDLPNPYKPQSQSWEGWSTSPVNSSTRPNKHMERDHASSKNIHYTTYYLPGGFKQLLNWRLSPVEWKYKKWNHQQVQYIFYMFYICTCPSQPARSIRKKGELTASPKSLPKKGAFHVLVTKSWESLTKPPKTPKMGYSYKSKTRRVALEINLRTSGDPTVGGIKRHFLEGVTWSLLFFCQRFYQKKSNELVGPIRTLSRQGIRRRCERTTYIYIYIIYI